MKPSRDDHAPPDQNCYTLPDGSCVGENCMHDPVEDEVSSNWKICPDCDGFGSMWEGETVDGERITVLCEMCQGDGGWHD